MLQSGDVLFEKAFIASGAVCLVSADITGQLSCGGAWLTGRDKNGIALHGEGIKVGNDLCLNAGFIACGAISLASAHAGALRWEPGEQICWPVDLQGADVAQLEDAWTQANKEHNGNWPAGGQLHLDGFTYRRLGGQYPATVKQRLKWIQSQYRPSDTGWQGFATQPYEQLAAVYRQAGLDTQARTAAIARRADPRMYGNLSSCRTAGNLLLDKTIKYGYETWRAAIGLVAVFIVFALLACFAQQHHLMVPVEIPRACPLCRLQPSAPAATRASTRSVTPSTQLSPLSTSIRPPTGVRTGTHRWARHGSRVPGSRPGLVGRWQRSLSLAIPA